MPYAHQFTLGYERELRPSLALHVDYVRAINKDMFLARNLNPALRVDTSRTGALTRSDAFGVLGEAYTQQVWVMENTGDADYNALDFSLEKRYSNRWSGRISYSLSKSTGTGNDQADKNLYQAMTNANLDLWRGPSNVDRRHILSLGAQTEIPKTGGVTLSATARYMSGAPFTIFDSSIDADRNGELVDPVPAGTYSGPSSNPDAMQNVTVRGRPQRRGRSRLLPARSARRLAAQDQEQQGARGLPRHLQRHQPRELRQPDVDQFRSPHHVVVPRADEPAWRRRVPSSGGDGFPVRVLSGVADPRGAGRVAPRNPRLRRRL